MSLDSNYKHLFCIHSPLTAILCKIIINKLGLKPEQVYVNSRASTLNFAVKLLGIDPSHFYNDSPDQQLEDNLLSRLSANKYTYLTSLEINRHFTWKCLHNMGIQTDPLLPLDLTLSGTEEPLYRSYQQIPESEKFIIYLPHLLNQRNNVLAQSPHCKEIRFFEDGSLNYIDYDSIFLPSVEQITKNELDYYPGLSFEYSGAYPWYFLGIFNPSGLPCPQHKLYDKAKVFTISELTFVETRKYFPLDITVMNYADYIDVNELAKSQEKIDWDGIHDYVFKQILENNQPIQEQLLDKQNINNFINVTVFEGLMPGLDIEVYIEMMVNLLKEVRRKGVYFTFIKHHPRVDSEIRLQLEERFKEIDILWQIIPDDISMEFECMIRPNFSMIVHAVSSSLLIYAAQFNQVVMPYYYLADGVDSYQELKTVNGYNIEKILNSFYEKTNTIIQLNKF